MKKVIKALPVMLAAALLFSGCAAKPGEDPTIATPPSEEQSFEIDTGLIGNPLYGNRVKLQSFDYGDITLKDGLFKQVFDGCMAYYHELTADDILWRWRKNAGMDVGSGRDLGWESGKTNAECCLAQLISAKARYYAVTGDENDLQVVKDILDGYQEIVNKTGTYPMMFSAYFYEKTLRAFLDCYTCCGLEQGYTMAKDFVAYGMITDPFKDPQTLLGDCGSEWYTMSEALYKFVDLARQKGEPATAIKEYIRFAELYEYTEFWDIFENDKNLFDYHVEVDRPFNDWFHAYSHANSFNSALEAYKQTGKSYYLEASQKFYHWLESTQKQATGGYGAQWEWLLPAQLQVAYLRTTNRSTETQCNAYAIVNIDNYLTAFTGDGAYGQWTEDAFYNMSIASLETENGCPTYYSDYSSDGGIKYLREDWPWACCAGTRPLVMMEYLRNVYFHDTKNLYVNLYTNSSISMTDQNGKMISLTQDSAFPVESSVQFTVNTDETEAFSLCFRKPQWLGGEATLTINGEETALQEENGWLFVERVWHDGDTLTLDLPMKLYYSVLEGESKTDSVYAVMYGPVTLACSGAPEGLNQLLPRDGDITTLLIREEGTLQFSAAADESIVFMPYYSYPKAEKYILYISAK